jgi:hypothetical protein
MKWFYAALATLVVVAAGWAYWDLVIDAPRREVKLQADMRSLDAFMNLQVCDLTMRIARVHGSIAEYEEGSDRLYFRYAEPRSKVDPEDISLLAALHMCAWKVEHPDMAGEEWQVDPSCVYPLLVK